MFKMETVANLKKNNRTDTDKPIIGIAFDARKTANSKEDSYFERFANNYYRAIRNAGGELYILGFDDNIDDFKNVIDGYLIPGGRDIHPRYYGQDVNGSLIGDQPDIHFGFHKASYEGLPKNCPLLGICWGFQFINVINGGSMIQDMPDKMEHYKKRRMTIKKDSWLGSTIGTNVTGSCYHHQALDRLAENVEPVAYDDASNLVHAIELKDPERFVVGVLWHPEITFKNESDSDYEGSAFNILKAFVEKCGEYKKSRSNTNGNTASA